MRCILDRAGFGNEYRIIFRNYQGGPLLEIDGDLIF